MSEDKQDLHPDAAYPEYVFDVENDEYDEEFIFYNSLRQLGYKIDLESGGVDDEGFELGDHELRVMAVDVDTRRKADELRTKFAKTPTSLTLGLMKLPADILSYIKTGRLVTFESTDPSNRIRLIDNPEVLKAIFMRGYELQTHVPDSRFRESDKYYMDLKAEGVEPIGVEGMGALAITELRHIIKESPELQPSAS